MIGWPLLLSTLPAAHAVGTYSHTPRFRKWGEGNDRAITNREYWAFVRAAFDLCLERVAADPHLWPDLADRLDHLPLEYRSEALDTLRHLEVQDTEIRTDLWEVLDRMWRRHREYPDSDWALPDVEIGAIQEVARSFEPEDLVRRHAWLFNGDWPDLGVKRGTEDYDEDMSALQTEALAEIWRQGGMDAARRLGKSVKSPWAVGWTLGAIEAHLDAVDIASQLDDEESAIADLATAYLTRVYRNQRDKVLAAAPQVESPLARARLLRVIQDLPSAWQAARDLGDEVDSHYWREFYPYGRGGDFPLANEVASELARHGRPALALDVLSHFRKGPVPIDAGLVVSSFNQLITTSDPEVGVLSSYEINELMQFLRDSPDVDEEDLARLEWQLLPALDADPSSSTLQRRLARSPEFFDEILSLVYRASDEEPSEPDEDRQRIASNAWRLLHDWRVVPGTNVETGEIDADSLANWIQEARALAANSKRVDVAELQIGQVLAQSHEQDAVWPPVAIQRVLEEHASATMFRGFSSGAFNRRGVTSRSLDEGGRQEYELSARYRAWADAILGQSPRTSQVLRDLADGYDAEGRRNDLETQRLEEGFGL